MYQNGNKYKTESTVELTPPQLTFKKKTICGSRSILEKLLILLVVLLVITVVVLASVFAVNNNESPSSQAQVSTEDICLTHECITAASRISSDIDTTVNPCDNFFDYSCGEWRKKTVIPEDRSSIDKFGVLRDEVDVILKNLLEGDMKDSEGEAVNKAKRLYKSCMNESLIEQRGTAVVDSLLAELGGWAVLQTWDQANYSLTDLLVTLAKYDNVPLISFYVYIDQRNSTSRILYIDQPGFGMPGRRYYLRGRDDPMVMAYEKFATSVAVAFSADAVTAADDMKSMVDLEMELANISMPAEDRRDNEALYNKMTIQQLSENFIVDPSVKFNWLQYVQNIMKMEGVNISITSDEPIIVRAVPYFEKLFYVLQRYDDRVVANYLVWRMMMNRISNLGEQFEEMRTEYNKVLYGTATPRARWRTCSSYVNTVMGLAVGRLFVEEEFDEEAKIDTLEMIANLKTSFNTILNEITWMDDATRKVARDKAEFIQNKIGYEDDILFNDKLDKMYENYTTESGKYFENVLRMLQRSAIDSLRLLRTPVNRTLWESAPATVNAFYNSLFNRIMFPAGILQPPFYSKNYPRSMNYGAIGVVIGHEITHGFDDRGRQYDKDGNLIQWWSTDIINNFKSRAECIVNQYGNFSLPEADGMKLNGIQTQGENIADNGGLKQSFRAYRKWVESQGKEERKLPGLDYTPNQLFFINFAQIWCLNMRRENAINRILTGVHSPGRFRVIGTLQNSEDFAKAFNCPAGSYMNPVTKCSVW